MRYPTRFLLPSFLFFLLIVIAGNDPVRAQTASDQAGTMGLTGEPLTLITPNGGERLVPGEEVVLAWSGVLPTDTVDISYSTDDGSSWLPAMHEVIGLDCLWRVPNTPSDRCLLRVRRFTGGAPPIRLVGHRGRVAFAAFSRDGEQVITTGMNPDSSVWIWDAATGREIRQLHGHKSMVRDACYSPDGNWIATGSDDLWIRIYDAHTGELKRSIVNAHVQSIQQVSFSPDGRYLLSLASDRVKIWDFATGELYDGLSADDQISSAAFAPDGRRIVISVGGRSEVWEMMTPDAPVLRAATERDSRGIFHTGFDPKGERLVSNSWSESREIRTWNASTGALIASLGTEQSWISSIEFDPTGEDLLSSAGAKVLIRNAIDGSIVHRLQGHYGEVYSAHYSADGHRVVTAGRDSLALIWNVDPVQEDRSDARWQIASPAGSIVDGDGALHRDAALQVFPNPLGERAEIRVDLIHPAAARITITDPLGRTLLVAFDGRLEAGVHALALDVSGLSSGAYYCTLHTAGHIDVRQIVIARP